ncbi:hypothetical protein PUR34_04555 [Streptomyces sp. JV185]|uniref:hypothetical protein n=1 Tax=Streptomyces sp. JV185 TaxID=858638 RepID=UPI002E7887B3|nr:hypothetical protein [Streptomyces sp. JV185]MEE1767468.1 hypothetical protein [Streptomyces sp. JV185]
MSGNDKLLRAARDTLPNPENSIEAIAALLGASVGTLYNHYRLRSAALRASLIWKS